VLRRCWRTGQGPRWLWPWPSELAVHAALHWQAQRVWVCAAREQWVRCGVVQGLPLLKFIMATCHGKCECMDYAVSMWSNTTGLP
jgi:hypothetical protein